MMEVELCSKVVTLSVIEIQNKSKQFNIQLQQAKAIFLMLQTKINLLIEQISFENCHKEDIDTQIGINDFIALYEIMTMNYVFKFYSVAKIVEGIQYLKSNYSYELDASETQLVGQNNRQMPHYFQITKLIGGIEIGTYQQDGRQNPNGIYLSSSNQYIYIGNYNNSISLLEYGKVEHFDGGIYEGEWKDNHHHGKGSKIFKNGDKYSGDWIDNKIQGLGRYSYSSGDIYEGQFQNNQFYGLGRFYRAQGDIFEGSFKCGNRSGFGIEKYANGDYFEGNYDYDNEELKSDGIMKYQNGDTYFGQMQMDGKGIYRQCGSGKLVKANNKVLEGIWENDQLIVNLNKYKAM